MRYTEQISRSTMLAQSPPSCLQRAKWHASMPRCDVVSTVYLSSLDDPGELAEGIAAWAKKYGSVTETSEEKRSTAVLGRGVRSLYKILTKRGLPAETRATVAAVASTIPQGVFATIVTGSNMGRSTTKGKFTNRNCIVRAEQGGQKPRSERVGLGVLTRKTAIRDKVRLEAGCKVGVSRPRWWPVLWRRLPATLTFLRAGNAASGTMARVSTFHQCFFGEAWSQTRALKMCASFVIHCWPSHAASGHRHPCYAACPQRSAVWQGRA